MIAAPKVPRALQPHSGRRVQGTGLRLADTPISTRSERIALVLIVALAFALRVSGITWQLPWRLHADEPPHVELALNQAATLDFSPAYVNQPPLYRDILAIEFIVLNRLGLMDGEIKPIQEILDAEIHEPHPVISRAYVFARMTNVVFGAGTVLLLFLAVRPLLGSAAALLGALTLTVSLAHVRETHFATTTALALFMSTLALYFAARFAVRGHLRLLLASIVTVGLAVSTRDLMMFSAAYPAAAIITRWFQPRRLSWWLGAAGLMMVSIAGMFLLYVLLTPYQSIDFLLRGQLWIPKISGDGGLKPPNLEVAPRYLVGIAQSMTVPLLGAAAIGGGLMVLRETRAALLLGSCFAATFLALMIHDKYYLRFGIPLEVFLACCAGYGLSTGIAILRRSGAARGAIAAAVIAPFVFPLANATLFGWLISREDTRVAARHWIQELPSGTLGYAPGFTLPNVKVEMSSGTPNLISHIWASDIPHIVTGAGCGEIVTLSSYAADWLITTESVVNARQDAQNRGILRARFLSGRGDRELDQGPDDEFSPFWNLWSWSRPGPSVELYEMSPPCTTRAPLHPTRSVLITSLEANDMQAWTFGDPRFTSSELTAAAPLENNPGTILASAVGHFLPGDPSPSRALLFELYGLHRVGIYRLNEKGLGQLVLLETINLGDCACLEPGGITALDVDRDSVDELLILRTNGGVQYLDVLTVESDGLRLAAQIPVETRDGRFALAVAAEPATATAEHRVFLLYEIGSQIWVDAWPLAPRTVSLERRLFPPSSYLTPSSSRGFLRVFDIADVDGDGRGEIVILGEERNRVEVFRIPHAPPGTQSLFTHYFRRPTPNNVAFVQRAPRDATAEPPPPPAQIYGLDQVGRSFMLLGLGIDRTRTFPLAVASKQETGSARIRGRDIVGMASGYFTGHTERSLIVMYQEGRMVSLELFPDASEGSFASSGIEIDRWRADDDDRPLTNSLVAVDLNRDGVDELASGRIVGQSRDQYELHAHRIIPTPRLSTEYLGRSLTLTPPGATFGAVTRIRRSAEQGDILAAVYRQDGEMYLGRFQVSPEIEIQFTREEPWPVPANEQVFGLAAGPRAPDGSRVIFLALRSPTERTLDTGVLTPSGDIIRRQPLTWPDERNARTTISGIE